MIRRSKKLVVALCVILTCVFLITACTNSSDIAGEYELISIQSESSSFADFEYCYLSISDNGKYTIEYKLTDKSALLQEGQEKTFKQSGKFKYKNNIMTVDNGIIAGNCDVQLMRLTVNLNINGIEMLANFVLFDRQLL